MTATSNSGPATGDEPWWDAGLRLESLRVGLSPSPASEHPDPDPDQPEHDRVEQELGGWERHLGELLAPFVAWLATQGLDEPERRRHRDAAERFLRWSYTDPGPVESRRRRYEDHLGGHDPGHLADARAGLGWWTDHRQILARTQMADRNGHQPHFPHKQR
ncbi:hypothetical protein [Pseudonocardia endophytica]|uniref:Uncharacterized protein n=1 Tax=Pseudonocardia endophytica TaxID=401976 RepID=A0A4R1HJD2_PSEEN|nr:hypothetical protein [Pseudonocardia endophytica]TCK21091.1 hypothetical protein EV378_5066 [Pseudonocardia endophytica]